MYCSKCLEKQMTIRTRVIDSRMQSNQVVRRRRLCLNCNYKFTTWESPMNLNSRENLLRKPQKELSRIRQLAQGIINRINKNE